MTKVRSEVDTTRFRAEPKKGIFQRLFYPLHIKLPIEIAATIAIAITTIYIFKTIQPEIKLAKTPLEKVAPQILSQEKDLSQRDTKRKKNIIPLSPPLEKGGKGGFEAEQPVPAGKPETVDKYAETTKSPEIAQQDKIMPFSGAMAKEESRREAPSATLKARTLKLIVKRLKKP